MVVWEPVPGASSYEVEVAPYTGGACMWTATSAPYLKKTPRARLDAVRRRWNSVKPVFGNALSRRHGRSRPASSASASARGPIATGSNQEVYGDYTYLKDGTRPRPPAFDWIGYMAGTSAGCHSGYLVRGRLPARR